LIASALPLKESSLPDVHRQLANYETMMEEKFGKDLTPHRVKYRTLKR
jgi:hypothetical protein